MRLLAAVASAMIVGLSGLTDLHPARAAAGGCSVASAPTIRAGQTQTSDPHACPDARQWQRVQSLAAVVAAGTGRST